MEDVEEDIEYVEYLHDEHHNPEAEDDSVVVGNEDQQPNTITAQIVEEEHEANEEEEEEEQVMLVEATEVLGDVDIDETQHTIIEHEGRQYLIPTEQLNGVGDTLVIEDEECAENEETPQYEVLEADADGLYTQEATSEDEDTVLAGRQFAVLRDGRLHLSDNQDTAIQEKLRVLEQTLSGYDEDEGGNSNQEAEEEEERDVQHEQGGEENEHTNSLQEENEAITGRNLVTGQTISLRGFMEKMRRREETKKEEFVTVRPINSRVVVGFTSDGKRLVGKIIQIQKKVQPLPLAPPRIPSANNLIIHAAPAPVDEPQGGEEDEEEEDYSLPPVEKRQKTMVNRIRPTPPTTMVTEPVARTLAGLMTLQSVRSSIGRRKLLVRHVQKRTVDGKVVTGSRRLAYYSGVIRRAPEPPHWKFISDPPTPTSIDLPDSPLRPQIISMLSVEDGDNASAASAAHCTKIEEDDEGEEEDGEFREPLILHLTETHDERGVKKTKVSIPQLANCAVAAAAAATTTSSAFESKQRIPCHNCGRRFLMVNALRRHQVMCCNPALRKQRLACHECHLQFETMVELNVHQRSHEPLSRYDCPVCHKQFNRHSNLVRHAQIHRTKQPPDVDKAAVSAKGPPFVCTQCECQYNYISSLTRHIVNEHKT